MLLCAPAQGGPATLQNAARALGADTVKSLTYTASGVSFAIGQNPVPGAASAPLHGRIVPLAELHRMIGRSN